MLTPTTSGLSMIILAGVKLLFTPPRAPRGSLDPHPWTKTKKSKLDKKMGVSFCLARGGAGLMMGACPLSAMILASSLGRSKGCKARCPAQGGSSSPLKVALYKTLSPGGRRPREEPENCCKQSRDWQLTPIPGLRVLRDLSDRKSSLLIHKADSPLPCSVRDFLIFPSSFHHFSQLRSSVKAFTAQRDLISAHKAEEQKQAATERHSEISLFDLSNI
ncbi:hypothetical protein RRG08_048470 [Elysia crispata]|uniref:Uncharacterized protein n=1 Tax=Elysia crispata TaxID=231223 RepID=A0AAE1ECQ1_9GAST|nr:hypothetical protein RRG08_048470 [Elysia crispata]